VELLRLLAYLALRFLKLLFDCDPFLAHDGRIEDDLHRSLLEVKSVMNRLEIVEENSGILILHVRDLRMMPYRAFPSLVLPRGFDFYL
jgi:hypothetical protein